MIHLPPSLDHLSCSSWLIYATRSESENARRIRALIVDIKEDRIDPKTRRPLSAVAIERAAQLGGSVASAPFEGDPMLVPVPGSGLTKPNTVWSARRLCEELVRQGLGADVLDIVRRTTAVEKSAGNRRRPTLDQHCDSFTVRPRLAPPARLVLVDDVVTTGTTLMACARQLAAALPGVPVSAFALARVQSTGDPGRVFSPLKELISISGDRCVRGAAPLSNE